jgi:Domain of unknown function (DUF5615)
MKILLLDENIPKPLKNELTAYQVYTINDLGWNGISDTEMLQKAVNQKFDILITADKNLEYQHKISNFSIALIVLYPKLLKWDFIIPLLPNMLAAIDTAETGNVYRIYP